VHVIRRWASRLRRRAAAEEGFTMATTILALLVVTLALAATVSAVNGDISITGRDLDQKKAYEAARAGLADYSFHLNKDNGYWAKTTSVRPRGAAMSPATPAPATRSS